MLPTLTTVDPDALTMTFRQPAAANAGAWPSARMSHMVLPYTWENSKGFIVFGGGQAWQNGFSPAEDSWFYDVCAFWVRRDSASSSLTWLVSSAAQTFRRFPSNLNGTDMLHWPATSVDPENARVISLGGIPYLQALAQLGVNGTRSLNPASSWTPDLSTVRVFYVDETNRTTPFLDMKPVTPDSGYNKWSINGMQHFMGSAAFYPTTSQYELLSFGGVSLAPEGLSGRWLPFVEPRFVYMVAGCQSVAVPNSATGVCEPCPRSFRSFPIPGRAFCTSCPAGTFSTAAGTPCQLCPAGNIRTDTTNPDCTPCGTRQEANALRTECLNLADPPSIAATNPAVYASLLVLLVLLVPAVYFGRRYRMQKMEERRLNKIVGETLKESDFGYAFLRYDDLEIGDELGSGSFGSVYRGTHKGTTVAIKVSKPGVVEGVREFLKEAETMMQMTPHPNVLSLVGVCTHAGSALVILEFVSGGSLDKLLTKGGVPEDKLKSFIFQLCSGLKHLHSVNIIHRDLACRNVLLDKNENGDLCPKISDFGMSRVVEAENQKGQTATQFGPVPWMAPEAIGELKYSPESDIWSLGVTIWELITRQDPSKQMPLVDLAVAIRDNGFHPRIPAWAPEWLKTILDGCWRKNPDERISLENIIEILGMTEEEEAIQQKRKSAVNPNYATIDNKKKKKKAAKVNEKKDAEDELIAMLQSIREEVQSAEQKLKAALDRNADIRGALGYAPRNAGEGNFAPPTAFAPPSSDADNVAANNRKSGWRRTAAAGGLSNTFIGDQVNQ